MSFARVWYTALHCYRSETQAKREFRVIPFQLDHEIKYVLPLFHTYYSFSLSRQLDISNHFLSWCSNPTCFWRWTLTFWAKRSPLNTWTDALKRNTCPKLFNLFCEKKSLLKKKSTRRPCSCGAWPSRWWSARWRLRGAHVHWCAHRCVLKGGMRYFQ